MKKFFFLLLGLTFAVSAFSQSTLPKPLNPKVSDWIDSSPTIYPGGEYKAQSQVQLECGIDWLDNPVADDYPGNKAVFEAMDEGIMLEYTTLDPDKVSYAVFTDNDKPFIFTPDRYPDLFEDLYPGLEEATRIPFGYEGMEVEFWFVHFPQLTNNVDVLAENGIQVEPFFTWRIGVQTYYTVDGETSESDIVYMEIFPQMKEAAQVTPTSFFADWSCDAENTDMVDGFKQYDLYIIDTETQETTVINNIRPDSIVGEWGNTVYLPGATYMVEGLTPGKTYQYYVESVGYYHSYNSVVREVTLPENNVYLLGQVNDQVWAANVGTQMAYDAQNKIYTATVNLNANETFGFTTQLANDNDQGAWNYIEPFRFGPESNGDFVMQDVLLGVQLDMTFDNYGAIKVLSDGDYKVTVSLEGDGYIMVEKVTPEPPTGLRGDVNDDQKVDIDDVTLLIDVVLGKDVVYSAYGADCNVEGGNGATDIDDVTALINRVLTGVWED